MERRDVRTAESGFVAYTARTRATMARIGHFQPGTQNRSRRCFTRVHLGNMGPPIMTVLHFPVIKRRVTIYDSTEPCVNNHRTLKKPGINDDILEKNIVVILIENV